MKQPVVYILASSRNGTLYTGVTSNLEQRTYQHKNDIIKGFSSKYGCKILVFYEVNESMESAILREKRLKKYRREDKIKLVEKTNPNWEDLYASVIA